MYDPSGETEKEIFVDNMIALLEDKTLSCPCCGYSPLTTECAHAILIDSRSCGA